MSCRDQPVIYACLALHDDGISAHTLALTVAGFLFTQLIPRRRRPRSPSSPGGVRGLKDEIFASFKGVVEHKLSQIIHSVKSYLQEVFRLYDTR